MNKSAQILLYRIILGCPLLLVAPEHALAAPSDPDWKEFQIPDLGTRVDYPAAVFSVSDGKSEVGVGERLGTADRRASSAGLCSCARLNIGGWLINARKLGLRVSAARLYQCGSRRGWYRRSASPCSFPMGLQQTTRGRLLCSVSVDWLNIALQNTAPARLLIEPAASIGTREPNR